MEELERKALSLQKEAAELFQKGHEDEAHSLEREYEALLLKVRQLQSSKQEESARSEGDREKKSEAGDPESQQDTWDLKPDLKRLLHERLQDLRAARQQAEARKAPEQELDEIREQISQTERKLAHLIESPHLPQEIPPQFRAQAEKLELAKAMQNSETKDQEPKAELQQLRSENEKLRREMKELREVIEQLRKETDK